MKNLQMQEPLLEDNPSFKTKYGDELTPDYS